MKNSSLKFFTGSVLLSALIFTGCGDGNSRSGEVINKSQPHQVKIEFNRGLDIVESADTWNKDVSISASYDRTDENDHKLSIDVLFNQGITNNVEHFQVYMDTDNNPDTGWSMGGAEYATTGADYMIEDGVLYKSTSTTDWTWTQMDEISYESIQEANNLHRLKIYGNSSSFMSITDIDHIKNLTISIEPLDAQWQDTRNFVSEKNIEIDIIGGTGNPTPVNPEPIDPAPVDPVEPIDPVEPEPVVPNETVYEDAENGLAAWFTASGQYTPERKALGNNPFVKLKTDWLQLDAVNWNNSAEYHLLINNQEQTILSVDLVGDGEGMHHYILGVQVTTRDGLRRLAWDSFYNHTNMPAERLTDDNGIIFMVFPSPAEMVRGYGYSDVNLQNNFRVDLEAALRQFEPNNEILSVDTFFATGGNLDNIKLLSQ